MKKKYLLVILMGVMVVGLGTYYFSRLSRTEIPSESKCEVNQIIFYYLPQCKWCQKVKNEGTLSELKKLGVRIKKINTATGPIRHKFQGVPAFVIKKEVYTGYQTLEQLKEKLGCREE